eukprot:Rmarinus@m.282
MLSISNDGLFIASSCVDTIKVWEKSDDSTLASEVAEIALPSFVGILSFLRDNNALFALYFNENQLVGKTWELPDGEILSEFNNCEDVSGRACISPSSGVLAIKNSTSSISVRDTLNFSCVGADVQVSSAEEPLAVSNCGRTLLSAAVGSNVLRGWRVMNNVWKSVYDVTVRCDPVDRVRYSSNGRWFVVSFEGCVFADMYDAATGDCMHTFTGHNSPIKYITFSIDDDFIVSYSESRGVLVWDRDSGDIIHEVLPTAIGSDVIDVCTNDSGTDLISLHEDGTVYIHRWTIPVKHERAYNDNRTSFQTTSDSDNDTPGNILSDAVQYLKHTDASTRLKGIDCIRTVWRERGVECLIQPQVLQSLLGAMRDCRGADEHAIADLVAELTDDDEVCHCFVESTDAVSVLLHCLPESPANEVATPVTRALSALANVAASDAPLHQRSAVTKLVQTFRKWAKECDCKETTEPPSDIDDSCARANNAEAIASLLEALPHVLTSEEATFSFTASGGLADLLNLIGHRDLHVRAASVHLLAHVSSCGPSVRRLLTAMLFETDSEEGSRNSSCLISLLRDGTPQARIDAATALLRVSPSPEELSSVLSSEGWLQPFSDLLQDKDPLVRGRVAQTLLLLAQRGEHEATVRLCLRGLCELLVDEVPDTRECALEILLGFPCKENVDVLVGYGVIPLLTRVLAEASSFSGRAGALLIRIFKYGGKACLKVVTPAWMQTLSPLMWAEAPDVRTAALRLIFLGQALSHDDIRATFCDEGGVANLVCLLLDENEDVREGAGLLLCALTEYVECGDRIADAGGIGALVSLLFLDSLRLKEVASVTLCRVLVQNVQYQPLLANAAEVSQFVALLDEDSLSARTIAVLALALRSHSDDDKPILVQSGGIRPLVRLLHNSSTSVRKLTAAVLGNIAYTVSTRKEIVDAGALAPLARMLHDSDDGVKENAALTLKLLAVDDSSKSLIAGKGTVGKLVHLFSDHSPLVRRNAILALRELCVDSETNQSLATNAGAIPCILPLLSEANDAIRGAASDCLVMLALNSSYVLSHECVMPSSPDVPNAAKLVSSLGSLLAAMRRQSCAHPAPLTSPDHSLSSPPSASVVSLSPPAPHSAPEIAGKDPLSPAHALAVTHTTLDIMCLLSTQDVYCLAIAKANVVSTLVSLLDVHSCRDVSLAILKSIAATGMCADTLMSHGCESALPPLILSDSRAAVIATLTYLAASGGPHKAALLDRGCGRMLDQLLLHEDDPHIRSLARRLHRRLMPGSRVSRLWHWASARSSILSVRPKSVSGGSAPRKSAGASHEGGDGTKGSAEGRLGSGRRSLGTLANRLARIGLSLSHPSLSRSAADAGAATKQSDAFLPFSQSNPALDVMCVHSGDSPRPAAFSTLSSLPLCSPRPSVTHMHSLTLPEPPRALSVKYFSSPGEDGKSGGTHSNVSSPTDGQAFARAAILSRSGQRTPTQLAPRSSPPGPPDANIGPFSSSEPTRAPSLSASSALSTSASSSSSSRSGPRPDHRRSLSWQHRSRSAPPSALPSPTHSYPTSPIQSPTHSPPSHPAGTMRLPLGLSPATEGRSPSQVDIASPSMDSHTRTSRASSTSPDASCSVPSALCTGTSTTPQRFAAVFMSSPRGVTSSRSLSPLTDSDTPQQHRKSFSLRPRARREDVCAPAGKCPPQSDRRRLQKQQVRRRKSLPSAFPDGSTSDLGSKASSGLSAGRGTGGARKNADSESTVQKHKTSMAVSRAVPALVLTRKARAPNPRN